MHVHGQPWIAGMSESGGSTGMLAMVDRVGRAWTCGHMPPTPPDR
jgi:hypothetical protein